MQNSDRVTWSVHLFLKWLSAGYQPPDLYDGYPNEIVEEYLFLREQYPAYKEDLELETRFQDDIQRSATIN